MSEWQHDDGWIAQAVREELEWAPHVDAARITVSVAGGVAHLSGHVRSLAERKAAERIVRHIVGVRGVTADLAIDRPAAQHHSDTEIARRAADVLAWDVQLAGADIRAVVDNGHVTLTGTVDWQYQREEAETRIHRLTGVLDVNNGILVRSAPADDATVRAQVLRALERHAEIDVSHITVAVDGGRVTLTGTVPGFAQRHIAENAAWSARGVIEVIDHVRVEPRKGKTPA